MSSTEDLKKALTQPPPKKVVLDEDLLSSGSRLFNLACTGRVTGAFPKGSYVHFVGDSQSGKTLLCYNTLAEAANNLHFKNYRLIYSNPERRAFWEVEKLWGTRLANMIEPPDGTKANPKYPRTVQDLYFSLYDSFVWGKDGRVDVKKSQPFIRIEDSMSSLDEVSRWDKFETNRELAAKGKDLEGSFGMGKAKFNSDNILWVVNAIADTGSILIIVNQTRDRPPKNQWDVGPKQTVAGGHSLKFYANHEIWSRVTGQITRTVMGQKVQVGTTCEVRTKKNSVTGKDRSVELTVYPDVGVDDTGSCVEWLIERGHWSDSSGTVTAPEFDHVGTREKLIAEIEGSDLESELGKIVQKVWNDIEDRCVVERKKRYS